MHIMEGFLPSPWWYVWFLFSTPVLAYGLWRMKRLVEGNPRVKMLLVLAGAFVFVLSSLKLPSVTGSCSHPTGTGLSVVLFGPSITAVLAGIVLIYQALLLAHGGITTWGANVASMGIIGPFIGWMVWSAVGRLNPSTKLKVFLTASVADLATYVVTSLQLAVAFPASVGGVSTSFKAFFAIFAVTQVPLAVIEGLVTVVVFRYLLDLRHEVLVELQTISPDTGGKGG
jgi:cobalt/nickel transport system permease protein